MCGFSGWARVGYQAKSGWSRTLVPAHCPDPATTAPPRILKVNRYVRFITLVPR